MAKKMLYTAAVVISLVGIGISGLFYCVSAADVDVDVTKVVDVGTSGVVASPSIHGNRVVWQDNSRNAAHNWEIYMYDLDIADETLVANSNPTLVPDSWGPVIYDDRIVYKRNMRYMGCDFGSAVHMYNTQKLGVKGTRIGNFTALGQSKPDVYKYADGTAKVVWEKNSKSDTSDPDPADSYIYCCSFGKYIPGYGYASTATTEISADTKYNKNPAIYGNTVVWERARIYSSTDPNYTNIAIYNVSTKTLTGSIKVTMGKGGAPLDIYEDKIVWQDSRNDSGDIYMYDITTKTETCVCKAAGRQTSPVIYKNMVVWQDDRAGNSDIYVYDLLTKKETCLSSDPANETEPAIYENKIVWVDGGTRIYAAILSQTADTTPPTGKISINNDATYATSASVTLTLSATDTGSGVSKTKFSNDNAWWSAEENYSATKTWTLSSGNGTKTVYAKFKDAAGNWSSPVSDTITALVTTETPWKSNENGVLFSNYNLNSACTMGYKFRSLKDGWITKLGGYFEGSNIVYLWDSSGKLLTNTTVTSNLNWSYKDIAPVEVKANQTYTVAVYIKKGACYRMRISALPRTYGNITIECGCSKSGYICPPATSTTTMYGLVDIGYVNKF